MERRTVEIAGAGLAGLFSAIAFAQRGWSVRAHERAAELRMFGAGIWMWENGLRALEAIGVADEVLSHGAQDAGAWEARDHKGRLLRRRRSRPGDRFIVPRREDLYNALIAGAEAAGVEIITSSEAVSASPEGRLVLDDSSELQADLVIAADGLHSKIRESLGLSAEKTEHGMACFRVLIPRLPTETEWLATEHWNGTRGVLYNPVSATQTYLCFGCALSDERASRAPLDKEAWIESFPHLQFAIERISGEGRWDRLESVHCKSWHTGRVAIVGDAAHGLPPTLGQAANLAFANCLALAHFASTHDDVAASLYEWERTVRPVTDHTQVWSDRYTRIANLWPVKYQSLRSLTVRVVTSLPYVERALNRAQRTPIVGVVAREEHV